MKTKNITNFFLACTLYLCTIQLLRAQTAPLFNPNSYYTISCTYQQAVYSLQASMRDETFGAVMDLGTFTTLDSSYMWRITPVSPGSSNYRISSLIASNNAYMTYNEKDVFVHYRYPDGYIGQYWNFTGKGNNKYTIFNALGGSDSALSLSIMYSTSPRISILSAQQDSQIWTITEVGMSQTSACNVSNNYALINSTLVAGYNSLPFVEQGVRYVLSSSSDTITKSMGKSFAASFNVPLNDLKANSQYYYQTYYKWAGGVTLAAPFWSNYFTTKASPAPAPTWGYSNTNWVCGGYSECGGPIQSPVALNDTFSISTGLPQFTTSYKSFPCALYDNGHALYVNPANDNVTNSITFNNKTYYFLQMHFHTPSEHSINGTFGAMEAHIVHRDPYTNALLVLAIMMKADGDSNPSAYDLLNKIYKAWPGSSHEINATEIYTQFKDVLNRDTNAGVDVDMNRLLPSNSKFYMYTGSLTTPPCWQGVTFLVYKDFVPIGKTISDKYAEKFHYNNARPIQPVNNRILTRSK